jgi:hypothetical protein
MEPAAVAPASEPPGAERRDKRIVTIGKMIVDAAGHAFVPGLSFVDLLLGLRAQYKTNPVPCLRVRSLSHVHCILFCCSLQSCMYAYGV